MVLSYSTNRLPAPPAAQQPCPCCGSPQPASRVLVDVAGNQIAYRGRTIRTEAHVANLAQVLANRFGQVVTIDRIVVAMWPNVDTQPLTTQKVIHVTVSKLRKLIKPLGLQIETVYSRGYRLKQEKQNAVRS